MTPSLSAIYVYPIKSCAPISVTSAMVEPRGLAHDRRWMIVDARGRFVSGREQPRMTLVRAHPEHDALMLEAPGMPPLELRACARANRIEVSVWKSNVLALRASHEADAWISAYLGCSAHFAHMDADCVRAIDPNYAAPGDEVSFADGFPLLVISEAALDGLNAKLAVPVPMLRFRPSIVVAGSAAHAEDAWKRVRIGALEFDVVKPCARCIFTTVDFTRGTFDAGGEPLRTLLGYRRAPQGVLFGQNLIPRSSGRLHLRDRIEVVE